MKWKFYLVTEQYNTKLIIFFNVERTSDGSQEGQNTFIKLMCLQIIQNIQSLFDAKESDKKQDKRIFAYY